LEKAINKANDYTGCRKCTKKCPYNLDIPIFPKENVTYGKTKNEFLNNKA